MQTPVQQVRCRIQTQSDTKQNGAAMVCRHFGAKYFEYACPVSAQIGSTKPERHNDPEHVYLLKFDNR